MSWNTRRDLRKIHRWGAILIALPFLIVLVTGLFLQLKKEFDWIQPPTRQGSISNETPEVGFAEILAAARAVPEAGIDGWKDVDRLDVRPDDGLVKVRSTANWELQIDLGSGKVLQSARRRSGVIESMHDGSWFHDLAKLWFFLPSALVVSVLWVTGIYLYFVPWFAKRRNRELLARRRRERRRKRRPLQGEPD